MSEREEQKKQQKARFLKEGLDSFDDYRLVELLLSYALPRGEVTPLAQRLMQRFGTLAAMLDAPICELESIPGMSENSITLFKFLPQLFRRYRLSLQSDELTLNSPTAIGEYLMPFFTGETVECVYLLCLDEKKSPIACKKLSQGEANHVNITPRTIAELALQVHASGVVLAHNHPNGSVYPSLQDLKATSYLRKKLSAVGIRLEDHIIVSDEKFVSLCSEKPTMVSLTDATYRI